MNNRLTAIVIALVIACTRHIDAAEAEAARNDGFVTLFNGKNFNGWRFSDSSAMSADIPSAWKIEGDAIIGTGDGKAILASQWDYADFELEFEWRALSDDYDADLYIHSGRLLDADPIRLAKGLDGGPQENDRDEGGYNASAKGQIGGSGRGRKAVPELQNPAGTWNAWKVIANKNIYILNCNGQEAWKAVDHIPRQGYLGFRVFKGPVEIRNIRLRESGYQSLMNLAEWEVYPGYGGSGRLEAHWKVDGDQWIFKGEGPSLVTKNKDYGNYNLRMEFMFADPNPSEINAGVYLRGVHPWQAEIWEHKWGSGLWGMLHGEDSGKVLCPIMRMDNPQGHWNYLDVRVENNVVSTWLNGRVTVDRYPIKQVDAQFPDRGGIGLQAHYPWKEIRYRNIRVRSVD